MTTEPTTINPAADARKPPTDPDELAKVEGLAKKRMVGARQALILERAEFRFFGSLSLSLRLQKEWSIDTMATNGVYLFYNPAFVLEVTKDERMGVIAHEVFHCALMHFLRKGGRNPMLWNYATDYAINPVVKDMGLSLPVPHLDEQEYRGLAAEVIYRKLEKKAEQQTLSISPENMIGEVMEAPSSENQSGEDKGEGEGDQNQDGSIPKPDEVARQWQVAVREAASTLSKELRRQNRAGDMPGELQRVIGQLDAPQLDPYDVLREFIDESACKTEAWDRPNRRFAASGIYIPGKVSDGIAHATVVIDTSGSIDRIALRKFAAEVQGFVDSGRIDTITILSCDTKVYEDKVVELTAGSGWNPEVHGGGGTAFSPAFEWIQTNCPNTSLVMYFTDLCCHDFGPEPEFPVMWLVYGPDYYRNDEVPFGRIIDLES